jgi:hypothetical protein
MQATPSIAGPPSRTYLIDSYEIHFQRCNGVLARIDQIGTSLTLPTRRTPAPRGRWGGGTTVTRHA